MIFNSYNSTMSMSTQGMSGGIYVSSNDVNVLNFQTSSTNIYYGESENDVIELSIWDLDKNQLKWGILTGSIVNNSSASFSYLNELNVPIQYEIAQINKRFTIYDDSDILVNPIDDLRSIGYVNSGSYYAIYNFIRDMAGSYSNQLTIQEISPSRTEIKLNTSNLADKNTLVQFATNKILISEIYQEFVNRLFQFPIDIIYEQFKLKYSDSIRILKNTTAFNADTDIIDLIRNIYEDSYQYNGQTIVRIQGIKNYFFNYLIENIAAATTFEELNLKFKNFVIASILRKLPVTGENTTYNNASNFITDLIYNYYYIPISNLLETSYVTTYYSPLNNSLNFGNNNILQIINKEIFTDIDNNVSVIIKLKDALPDNIDIKNTCWISNISIIPIILQVSISSQSDINTIKIGTPNFFISDKTKATAIENKKYYGDNLLISSDLENNIEINKKINELNIDYSDFKNFIVFSSAEIRLKIFKNKALKIGSIQDSLGELNLKNQNYILNNGFTYPYYDSEVLTLTENLDSIVYSFDGYEAWLYNSGNYKVSNGTFAFLDIVDGNDSDAISFDKMNNDSLIKNTPAYILKNSDNDDYIIFLAMIGHFFDNIRLYISEIPSSKLGESSDKMSLTMLNTVLAELGWDVSDILLDNSIYSYYLPISSSILSSIDQSKVIQARLLDNLPIIYKTKGTEASVKSLLTCYGIPASLLNIREYGGYKSTYSGSYTFSERAYMYTWNEKYPDDTFTLNGIFNPQLATPSYSYLYKLKFDDSSTYFENDDNILLGAININGIGDYPLSTDISASGDWATGFIKTENGGKIYFRVGYKGQEIFNLVSDEISLFDGNVYSVLIRQNDIDSRFDTNSPIPDTKPRNYDLIVQRNSEGYEVINSSTSYTNYNSIANDIFTGNSTTRIMIGGWFKNWNSTPLKGSFDKLEIFSNAISNGRFVDYVNNINSYSNDVNFDFSNLLFRMHVDYPFNVSASVYWPNANTTYPIFMTGSNIWPGNLTASVYNQSACAFINSPVYPYQFSVIDYDNEIGISNYGQNLFNNKKITKIDQQLLCRLDNTSPSSMILNESFPSSNQVGIFVDPQDFKNKDIIRQFGTYNLIGSIISPTSMFDNQYSELAILRNQYVSSKKTELKSTLFSELMTIYRLYFPPSLFQSIKKLLPARAETFEGILISPTILERPKYQFKPIQTDINTGDALQLNINLSSSFYYAPSANILYMNSGSYNPYDFNLSIKNNDTILHVSNEYFPNTLDSNQSEISGIKNGKLINGYFPSGSYCVLKRWKKYQSINTYNQAIAESGSIYLYDYIKLPTNLYSTLVYTSSVINSDISVPSDLVGSLWQHYPQTFINSPNATINNYKLSATIFGTVVTYDLPPIQITDGEYFEISNGTPRYHKSHKRPIFSAYTSVNPQSKMVYKRSQFKSTVPNSVIGVDSPILNTNLTSSSESSGAITISGSVFMDQVGLIGVHTSSCNYNIFDSESSIYNYSSLYNISGTFPVTASIFNYSNIFTGKIEYEDAINKLYSAGFRPATLCELYAIKSLIGNNVIAIGTQLGYDSSGNSRGYPIFASGGSALIGSIKSPFKPNVKFAAVSLK